MAEPLQLTLCSATEGEESTSRKDIDTPEEAITRELRTALYRYLTGNTDNPCSPDENSIARLVRTVVSHAVDTGKCRELRYLTDLAGIGEQAERKRASERIARERLRLHRAPQSGESALSADYTGARENDAALAEALNAGVPQRSLADIFQEG
ncbi:MAG: hypothetical protein IJ708_04755 [Clostridia bacterium]|nr:hypothetical protein [Clostridia bacterium]